MTLNIISSSGILFSGEADAVSLPGQMGRFMVLKNHASLIASLVKGKVIYRKGEDPESEIEIKGGLADINNNVVSVCIY